MGNIKGAINMLGNLKILILIIILITIHISQNLYCQDREYDLIKLTKQEILEIQKLDLIYLLDYFEISPGSAAAIISQLMEKIKFLGEQDIKEKRYICDAIMRTYSKEAVEALILLSKVNVAPDSLGLEDRYANLIQYEPYLTLTTTMELAQYHRIPDAFIEQYKHYSTDLPRDLELYLNLENPEVSDLASLILSKYEKGFNKTHIQTFNNTQPNIPESQRVYNKFLNKYYKKTQKPEIEEIRNYVRSTINENKHTKRTCLFGETYSESFGAYEGRLTEYDYLTIYLILKNMEKPEVLEKIRSIISQDIRDNSREYGGLIFFKKDEFSIVNYSLPYGNNNAIYDYNFLEDLPKALASFHLHAVSAKPFPRYAGPSGSDFYYSQYRELLITPISENEFNVDVFFHGDGYGYSKGSHKYVIDLGNYEFPNQ
ncbi:MAG: hypothetical protein ABIA04_01850 [Pseudomonadota bacterium]